MGDEGVGVHAIRALGEAPLPAGTRLVDGGTGGFQLLSVLEEGDPLILIDATLDGRPAGTVRVLKPRFATDFPRSLGAHDIGLRDLVEAAALLGPLPRVDLVTISVARLETGLTLSPEVAASLPEVVRTVKALLEAHG